MKNAFVQEALQKVPNPDVLVNIVSRRVQQLGQGFRPMVQPHPRWTFMDIALKEISEGKLEYELLTPTAEPAAPAKKRKRSS